ncbi:MAG: hypothetical protein H6Q65_1546 [Firmicutes bacterium]|nr:hypothetical protein [Bacillota bacterium]
MQKNDLFEVKIGDTERTVDEVISSIQHSDLPIAQIQPVSTTEDRRGVGAVLTLHMVPGKMNEDQLKRQLNEYGACMFQVESVVKIPE